MVRLHRPSAAAFAAIVLASAVALAPGVALARLGGGGSVGSRGSMTYSAPPSTGTAPGGGLSMQRSITPRSEPSPGVPGGYAQPGYAGGGFGRGGGFASGLMGGLIGAGIGGMLFGHGMFGGLDGGSSFLGLLIQFALLFFVGRWLFRMVMARQPMLAGAGGVGAPPRPGMGGGGGAARPGPAAVTITDSDYKVFEQLLKGMQQAWSNGDLNALRSVATPEMTGYFGEQLAELNSRGLRNTVCDVRLEQGDLAQAWSEGSREYATVAMRFSMIDVTRDAQGRVVDGSLAERQVIAELWTFLRAPGGRWLLSAIQQTR